MNINPITSLKWSAFGCAVLWGGGMVWWIGSYDPAAIVIFSLAGALFGLCWYLAMRFIFERRHLLPGNSENQANEVPRSKFHRWMVWAIFMLVTGLATAFLVNLVDPLIPAGDWHRLLRSLFIVVTWPALGWSVRSFVKGHLPA
jgi:hypothetical protein